jgi:hypothetical protein
VGCITVFVADPIEWALYIARLPPDYFPHIVQGVPGINGQRTFIEDYYPANTKVLCLDDDIRGLKCQGPPLLFSQRIEKCFELAEENDCRLWGISPSDNGLSMKDEAVVGLRFIIGSFFGFIAGRTLEYPDPLTEDWTRTLEYYARDGRVLRFNGMGPTTSYAREPGGLSEVRKESTQAAQMQRLCLRYPLATLRTREGKLTDVRLKLLTEKRIVAPFSSQAE